jgi:hypothetical protein
MSALGQPGCAGHRPAGPLIGGTTPYLGILHVTDGSKRAFGLEVADVGLALQPKNIGAGVSSCSSRLTGGAKAGTNGQDD